jgi:hypothetical protein
MMEHLCIGSFARFLTSCAIAAERKFDSFCEKIMLALCDEGALSFSYVTAKGDTVTYSTENFNKLLAGKQNLPTEVMQLALNKDRYAIENYFIENIIPALEEGRKKNAVLGLKYIIINDSYIDNETQLGTIDELTKNELRTKNEFVLSEFLTDIFIFTIAHTDNTKEIGFTKSINKTAFSIYDAMKNTITLYKPAKPISSPKIPLTIKGNFSKIFTLISKGRMANASERQDLQIYCLKFEDKGFDYNGLWRYLRNNIGYYVFSRAQIQQYSNNGEIESVSYDAVDQLRQLLNGNMPAEELGEILLYVFLEQVLKAPKFMSHVELEGYGGFNISKSSGIHILATQSPLLYSQIVFGASCIEGNINLAIDNAFQKAAELKGRKREERHFVESKIFAETFTKDIAATLESIILPAEKSIKKPDTAFGMFIGYSLRSIGDSGTSPEEYQSKVVIQEKRDILAAVPYIEQEITKYNLEGYSIYIYVLPFTDADVDKKKLMDRLLQTGGVSI